MPFPKHKVFFCRSFGSIQREVVSEKPDGSIESRLINCNVKLPSSEKFDISAQVKAGLNLQEVNTNVLSGGSNLEELSSAISTIKENVKKSNTKKNPDDQVKE